MRFYHLIPLCAIALVAGCGSSSSASGGTPTATAGIYTPSGQNHVHSIAVLPSNPRVLYLGGHYHLAKSTDGGHTWHPLLAQMMISMALDPARPNIVFGVTNASGILKTTDGGRHWTPAGQGIPHGQATGIAIDPTGRIVIAYGSGVYRSTDGGLHWSHALAGTSIDSLSLASHGLAYAASGNGLYVSRDAGKHWRTVSAIGTQPVIQVVSAHSVAYAVTATVPLFKTSDGGRTWRPLNSAPFGIEYVGVSPTNPREVFGEIAQRGLYASHDGGLSWRPSSAGIHDKNFTASTIRVAPSSPNVVYTGSWGIHFYASHDGGHHWIQTATLVH
ncbi:MAG: hypothetical protein NVS4B2_05180 [Chloroflexota bacterium]